jgi:hypothetical protein
MFEFQDVQEAAAALPDLQFSYSQMQPGRISVAVRVTSLGQMHITEVGLDRLSEGVGQVLPGRVVFVCCHQAPSAHLFDRQPLGRGEVFFTAGGRQSESILRAGFQASLINLDESHLRRLLRAEPSSSLGDHRVCPVSPAARPGAPSSPLRRRHLSRALSGAGSFCRL